ncbi:isochorismatase family [Pyrrhoderma noxium]|uniref:Isochorismatase family n=1 Tax=Pyrrhoderma noxium TaxID=2282107 RepID=A0A286U5D5_9AGAM|nr:isochorismatase family [Pyrrhoderma noxium]
MSDTMEWRAHLPVDASCFGEGDTYLVHNVLPSDIISDVFQRLRGEVKWASMSHRGGDVPRLIAVEGEISPDGSFPIYRHPSDTAPPLLEFTPTVKRIRDHVSSLLHQPLNHVLIQWYRNGNDYIAEHADKTVDIVRGSAIINVSIGSQRTMILRFKKGHTSQHSEENITDDDTDNQKDSENVHNGHNHQNHNHYLNNNPLSCPPPRKSQRIPLPHNSLFILGPETNRKWTHGIKPDKRLETLKSDEEIGEEFGGGRISLTFRWIGTFLGHSPSPSPRLSERTNNDDKGTEMVGRANPMNREDNADIDRDGDGDGDRDESIAVDEEKGRGMVIWGQGATGKTREEARVVVNGGEEAASLLRAFGEENHSPSFDWDSAYGGGFDVLHLI